MTSQGDIVNIIPNVNAELQQRAKPETQKKMGISNEYWLLGIIIVLITVILMLIVYIVRIRQEDTPPELPQRRQRKPREDEDEPQQSPDVARLANKPFTPHSPPFEMQGEKAKTDTAENEIAEDNVKEETKTEK